MCIAGIRKIVGVCPCETLVRVGVLGNIGLATWRV